MSYEKRYSKKEAGYGSEFASQLNPLNLVGGPIGALTALTTPTRSLAEQAEHDEEDNTLRNLLIPGVGAYNNAKRIGTSIRGPELQEMIEDYRYGEDEDEDEPEKSAGIVSEAVGLLNPLNLYGGNFVGPLAALATPTKSLKEQAKMESRGGRTALENLLIPGVAPYRGYKRLGTSIRGPELQKERRSVRKSKRDAHTSRRAARDGDGDGKVHDGTPEEKEAFIYAIEKVAAYRRVRENQARATRIKLASNVLRMSAIRQELDKYDPYRLSKSAAVGADKELRLKAAALVRQIELEKQACVVILANYFKQA
jgi:hypothetical protein